MMSSKGERLQRGLIVDQKGFGILNVKLLMMDELWLGCQEAEVVQVEVKK